MTFLYRLHGLTVRSDLELRAPTATTSTAAPDLTLRRGPTTPVPADPPGGRLIAETVNSDGTRFCSAADDGSGVVLRYHGLCEFRFSPTVESVEWLTNPGVATEVASVMAAGGLMSMALILTGRLILHASAVAAGSRAVAFVGRSGMGKSTLATLACRAGCRFLTDDVLRIDGDTCYRGSTESRLRSSAAPLAEDPDGKPARPTIDGRLGVELALPLEDQLPLGAIVVPQLDRGADSVAAQRVPVLSAIVLLSQFPRVLGWQDPRTAAEQFQLLADAASAVPVWLCRIPWPPTPPALMPDLLSALSLDTGG